MDDSVRGAYPLNTMNDANKVLSAIQLISGVFEHSVLRVWEIYALENARVLHCTICAVQTHTHNIQTHLESTVCRISWRAT